MSYKLAKPEFGPVTSQDHQTRWTYSTKGHLTSPLVISTLGKLQRLVSTSYASAVGDAFSSLRNYAWVVKILWPLYTDLQNV